MNSPDFFGETPLHVAVMADASDCVVVLLDHGNYNINISLFVLLLLTVMIFI